jgi:hypothetical protein
VHVQAVVAERALKLSTKQFCTGLPGWMKSIFTPYLFVHRCMKAGISWTDSACRHSSERSPPDCFTHLLIQPLENLVMAQCT